MESEAVNLGTYGFAVAMGALSFLSPCVFPLIPVYLTTMTGLSFADLTEGGGKSEARAKVLKTTLAFSCGISLVFVALGAAASSVGQFLSDYQTQIAKGAGVIVVLFGVYMLLSALGKAEIGFLNRTVRFDDSKATRKGGVAAAFIMGAAFAFGWSPCVGPFLGGILLKAATTDSLGQGVALLAAYSAGMCVPFILVGLLFSELTPVMSWIKQRLNGISAAAGALLILFGVMLFSGNLSEFQKWALNAQVKIEQAFKGESAEKAGSAAEPGQLGEVAVVDKESFLKALNLPGDKAVLVNFWATYCPPCRKEFPDLVEIGETYRDKGLRTMAVSADDLGDLDSVKGFLAEKNSKLEHFIMKDVNAQDEIVRQVYRDLNWGGTMPATFLYSPDGKMAHYFFGEFDRKKLEAEIAAVLGLEASSAPSAGSEETDEAAQ